MDIEFHSLNVVEPAFFLRVGANDTGTSGLVVQTPASLEEDVLPSKPGTLLIHKFTDVKQGDFFRARGTFFNSKERRNINEEWFAILGVTGLVEISPETIIRFRKIQQHTPWLFSHRLFKVMKDGPPSTVADSNDIDWEYRDIIGGEVLNGQLTQAKINNKERIFDADRFAHTVSGKVLVVPFRVDLMPEVINFPRICPIGSTIINDRLTLLPGVKLTI